MGCMTSTWAGRCSWWRAGSWCETDV
jgi:hypothetical protein